MEKTKFIKKQTLDATYVIPRTLTSEVMPYARGEGENRVEASMFGVFGTDKDDRRVWVATFADVEEAQAWVFGSKSFARPVLGFVMPIAENSDGETREQDRVAGEEQPRKSS